MHRKTADKLLVAQNHLLSDAFLAVIFVIERYIFSINFLILRLLIAILCVYRPKYSTTDFGLPKGFLAKV